MFKTHREPKWRYSFLPFVIFRTILSIVMMIVLGVGVYQAYRHFSGVDPLTIDPKSLIASFITSEKGIEVVNTILSWDIKSAKDLKKVLTTDKAPTHQNLPQGNFKFRFAVLSDSHNDSENLRKALLQAKATGAKFIIGLGDYTDVGTKEDLQKAKAEFQSIGLPLYTTAGDHDLWEARDKGINPLENFNLTFGSAYQQFMFDGVRFVLIYNSDNYNGIDELQMQWLDQELTKIRIERPRLTFAFMHEPLFHPSSDHVMGKSNKSLTVQAQKLAQMLKEAAVTEVLAADTHFFSRYMEPKSLLNMVTVGAITRERNAQSPRYVSVDVFDDGYDIQDVEIK